MQRLEEILTNAVIRGVSELWQTKITEPLVQIQRTRREIEGDLTVVVFPFVRLAGKSPEETAEALGKYLSGTLEEISNFNVIKGFLNLTVSESFWLEYISFIAGDDQYGLSKPKKDAPTVMVEYSSPNTNKPLHLGHVRNNLLGYSMSKILEANGFRVIKVNLVNDRGIHICKSMIAWQLFGNGETPESSGKKGDKLVGDYYVRFDKEHKKQVAELIATGLDKKEAEVAAPIM
ncbi:MAG: arginine--tRNA ligase, partial [Bacteroidales bacterium]